MRCKRTLGVAAAALVCVALSAHAQVEPIVLDGSFDPSKTGFAVPLVDGNYDITDDLGRFSENDENLFHSFSRFDIPSNAVATFSSSKSPSRVIARVTAPGDQWQPDSQISGTLRCTIVGADFFLLNPWGISFNDGAELDVQGSFHASSADVLRFADGVDFDARSAASPAALSAAAPSAFGFTSARPAAVAVFRSEGLHVPAGETLSFIGGEVTMLGRSSGTVPNVLAPGARVQIAAVGDPALVDGPVDVPVDLSQLDPAELPRAADYPYDPDAPASCRSCGKVSVSAPPAPPESVRPGVDVSSPDGGGQPAGSILIRGGRFELVGSRLIAEHDVDPEPGEDAVDAAGPIDVAVKGEIDIRAGSKVLASSEAQGRGGDVWLSGESVSVSEGSSVAVLSAGAGESGDMWIEAVANDEVPDSGRVRVTGGGSVFSRSDGQGAGGAIEIHAESVLVSNETNHAEGTFIFSETRATENGGQGGDLTVRTRTLDLVNGGQIFTRTSGSGDAGSLRVLGPGFGDEPADFVHLSGVDDEGRRSGITARAIETATEGASGGSLTIDAHVLEVANGAQISSATFGAGSAGDLTIRGESVTVRGGEEGFTLVSAASRPGTGNPLSLGASGNLTISAQSVALVDGGQVSVSTAGTQDAGNIEISADNVSISGVDPGVGNPSSVAAQTNAQGVPEGGDGGNITITARENLRIADGGRISVTAEPYTDGDAGLITLDVGGTLELASGGVISALSAEATTGQGGSIAITAGERVSLAGGSEVSASSFGSGNAGRIEFSVPRFESRDSFVTTEAGHALGGQIEIHAAKSVKLVDSTVTTSVFGEPGDGGNINIGDETIHPELVVLDGSTIEANSLAGRGGTITIWADALLQSPDSVIEAKAPPGLEGIVEVNAPEVALAGDLATLPESFLDASALLTGACEARTARAGSFAVQRRAALPAPPDTTASLASAGLPAVGAAPELPQCPLGEEAP